MSGCVPALFSSAAGESLAVEGRFRLKCRRGQKRIARPIVSCCCFESRQCPS